MQKHRSFATHWCKIYGERVTGSLFVIALAEGKWMIPSVNLTRLVRMCLCQRENLFLVKKVIFTFSPNAIRQRPLQLLLQLLLLFP
jgi:hypothetical protein